MDRIEVRKAFIGNLHRLKRCLAEGNTIGAAQRRDEARKFDVSGAPGRVRSNPKFLAEGKTGEFFLAASQRPQGRPLTGAFSANFAKTAKCFE